MIAQKISSRGPDAAPRSNYRCGKAPSQSPEGISRPTAYRWSEYPPETGNSRPAELARRCWLAHAAAMRLWRSNRALRLVCPSMFNAARYGRRVLLTRRPRLTLRNSCDSCISPSPPSRRPFAGLVRTAHRAPRGRLLANADKNSRRLTAGDVSEYDYIPIGTHRTAV